jgi:hypothetical protein
MTLDISEDLITDGARKTHRVMEDGAAYSFEQVRAAFVASITGVLNTFLTYPEGVTGDYPECRPTEFNEALGIL